MPAVGERVQQGELAACAWGVLGGGMPVPRYMYMGPSFGTHRDSRGSSNQGSEVGVADALNRIRPVACAHNNGPQGFAQKFSCLLLYLLGLDSGVEVQLASGAIAPNAGE